MKKLLKFSLIGGAGAAVAVSLFILAMVVGALRSLPDVEKLVESYAPSLPTTIYDSEGRVVDLISREMREEVDMDEIPQHVKDAFVAIEDRRFYRHPGLDPIRLGKATLVNLSKGRFAQGGSTITQQLAKNAFLSNEKKLMRKVKEALIALEIEKRYSKEEILKKYMNEIYFGSGFYGIETASQSFFGKKVSELSLPEAALLAGIPNRPSYYNPRRNLENAVRRSHLVLLQMRKQGLIGEKDYDEALKHSFFNQGETPKDLKESKNSSVILARNSRNHLKSPDFTDIIERKLFELFDENQIYEEGLQVYTSLDLDMQRAALETFNNYQPLKNNPNLQGALITIDSSNGYVKSIVGGKNFKGGNFNRATRALRQPGSAFKPFVYFTALEEGIPMNAVREDSELTFGRWRPQNYGKNFVGDITLLEAMEKSINIIAIKLLKEVGINSVIKNVEKTGAEMEIPRDLTAALGTMTTTPQELATAYLPFSNGGFEVEPIFITKILNRDGQILYERQVKRRRVFESTDVSLIVHMMKDVVANGSGRRARVVGRDGSPIEQGGKTGTTNDFRSAWYAGITPEYVTTLYVGYDDNSSMSPGYTGGSLAAPLWRNYYQRLINKGIYKPGRFEFMEEHIRKGDLVLVDIDSRTGLAGEPTTGSRRTGLFKKGQEPQEKRPSRFLRFKGFFSGEEKEPSFSGRRSWEDPLTPEPVDSKIKVENSQTTEGLPVGMNNDENVAKGLEDLSEETVNHETETQVQKEVEEQADKIIDTSDTQVVVEEVSSEINSEAQSTEEVSSQENSEGEDIEAKEGTPSLSEEKDSLQIKNKH
ncbi:penicillin-binding protein [Propionigenium maris DSM 9537]|uniref:Penicillin-binding protein n=1 Tax=Propionigenium maris DSM 9537 TaxID=1123000 RepID=A0A9W6GLY2_9FUSO|nr:PBP1A family penicillin-binding protein [Propionigenium maris]GLI56575.1 penicillin-binding protein [Propionigenium maris DSM 9537]